MRLEEVVFRQYDGRHTLRLKKDEDWCIYIYLDDRDLGLFMTPRETERDRRHVTIDTLEAWRMTITNNVIEFIKSSIELHKLDSTLIDKDWDRFKLDLKDVIEALI
jgi:hypothetical protein